MKIVWKALLWSIPVVISIFALVVATSYPTAQANTESWSPFFAAIPVGLGNFLSKRLVLFLLTAVVFGFLSYRITRWTFERRIAAAYQRGLDEAKPSESILGSVIENAQPSERKSLNPPSIDQLAYAIRQTVDALVEPGILDNDTVSANMILVKAEHPVWHILSNYNVRKSFISVVEKAHEARELAGNSAVPLIGDYKPAVREHHVVSLKNCSNKLLELLYSPDSIMKMRRVV
ncbi:hypothetical protein C8J42_102539 [Sphingomonas sp. PP-CE-1A-559]|uniref:hypothetical protein n=1 Tax=Sphingomonas sp. PP-CE-1A-559 TaxID=2135657 RepID=UPI0010551FD6|nr:hypothetical protein [Sphingomonas sp. PP-CE-1A-559]TCP92763.1 hypothetical protein C8J42_102539 [Sphingomonas sp. PP-CE-1A-559]